MDNYWLSFVRQRLWDLHREAFLPLNPNESELAGISRQQLQDRRLTYLFYSKEENRLGYGVDVSQNPNFKLPLI